MRDFRFNLEGVALTKSEEKIVNYIYNHLAMIPYLSIDKISKELNISAATFSRFVRHIGYADLKDLKASIIDHENMATPAVKLKHTLLMSEGNTITELFKRQENYLARTVENLSEEDVHKAVQVFSEKQNIYLFGKGAASGLVELLAFRLNRFQKNAIMLPSSGSELFEKMISIKKDDLIVLFGFYRMPAEARVVLKHARTIGCETILFTDMLYSDEEQRADINLFVYRGELREYHSMTAVTALIDTLVIMTAQLLGDESVQKLADLYQLKEKYSAVIPR